VPLGEKETAVTAGAGSLQISAPVELLASATSAGETAASTAPSGLLRTKLQDSLEGKRRGGGGRGRGRRGGQLEGGRRQAGEGGRGRAEEAGGRGKILVKFKRGCSTSKKKKKGKARKRAAHRTKNGSCIPARSLPNGECAMGALGVSSILLDTRFVGETGSYFMSCGQENGFTWINPTLPSAHLLRVSVGCRVASVFCGTSLIMLTPPDPALHKGRKNSPHHYTYIIVS